MIASLRRRLRSVVDIRPGEAGLVFAMFLFWFLVITVFQLLKPLKNGLFIEYFGAARELYAKLANIALAAVSALGFAWAYQLLRRRWLLYAIGLFFIFNFLVLSLAMPRPAPWAVWWFYLLGDMVTTLWVTGFWAYLTDIATADQAARLFGFIGGGGVIGGWAGASVADLFLRLAGTRGLLVVAAAMTAAVIPVVWITERKVETTRSPKVSESVRRPFRKTGWRTALDGARLVLRSRYLLALVALVAAYEFVSQTLDYVFKTATEQFSGVAATQQFMAHVYLGANVLAVVVQFFLVSLIIRKYGLSTALLILPAALLLSSALYAALPTLAMAGWMVIFDNGLNYSMEQTARETLYVPACPDEKYKARAFVNMFVQRCAKGLSILLLLVVASIKLSIRGPLIVGWILLGIMIGLSLFLGRSYARKVAEPSV